MDERTLPHLRVAIIHYWLTGMRGGEKVVEALCRIFPQADIYTHVVRPEALSETITSHPIHTTFIQKLPGSVRHYQKYLPLMPLALEQLDLRGYDLVIRAMASIPFRRAVSNPLASGRLLITAAMRA